LVSSTAQEFQEELNKLRALVKERAQERLEAFRKSQALTTESIKQMSRSLSVDLSANGDINLMVEIVSATDLPIADRNSTDPYVIVFMGKQEIHRTPHCMKT
jgi:Ca2+-dependent lipid-binding protein